MSVYSIEEQIQAERQLERAGFSVFFTLTTGTNKDNPLELRNHAFGFVQRVATKQDKPLKYWFAICRNSQPCSVTDSLYHVHGFLGDLDGITDLQQLKRFWCKSWRERDQETHAYKTYYRSLGRTDFQHLYGDPYVFSYVAGQMAMEPCTNVALLKPDSIRHQVASECGGGDNAS
jgi:hypothetical protein